MNKVINLEPSNARLKWSRSLQKRVTITITSEENRLTSDQIPDGKNSTFARSTQISLRYELEIEHTTLIWKLLCSRIIQLFERTIIIIIIKHRLGSPALFFFSFFFSFHWYHKFVINCSIMKAKIIFNSFNVAL